MPVQTDSITDAYYDTGIHEERFRRSIEWIKPYCKPGARVLEVGGCGKWTRWLLDKCPGVLVDPTIGDIRMGSLTDGPDGMYDVVVCMEVLEHVWDQPIVGEGVWPDAFLGTGAKHLLKEIHRVLKPGGVLHLTTPNACSANTLWKLLNNNYPMMYRPHIREYAPHELKEMVCEAGLKLERFETLEVWNQWGPNGTAGDMQKMLAIMRHVGVSDKDRGEDMFLNAKKPL